jgi:hypothetical protein
MLAVNYLYCTGGSPGHELSIAKEGAKGTGHIDIEKSSFSVHITVRALMG